MYWCDALDWRLIPLWVRSQLFDKSLSSFTYKIIRSATDEWYNGQAPVPGPIRETKIVDGNVVYGAKLDGSHTYTNLEVNPSLNYFFHQNGPYLSIVT